MLSQRNETSKWASTFIVTLSETDLNSAQDKRRRYSMMRSIESASSVFYHSQEEDPAKTAADSQGSNRDVLPGPLCDSYHDTVIDGGAATAEHDASGNSTAHASKMKLSIAITRICSVVVPNVGFNCSRLNPTIEWKDYHYTTCAFALCAFFLFSFLPQSMGLIDREFIRYRDVRSHQARKAMGKNGRS